VQSRPAHLGSSRLAGAGPPLSAGTL